MNMCLEHSRCTWCGKPIMMGEPKQTMLDRSKKQDFHLLCFDAMKHSAGLDCSLEGCAIEDDV